MFKFIFDLLTDPLGLPIEWYWEYIILLVIGAVAYAVAYRCVGDMYSGGMIDGSTSGSFFHWLIRLILFVILWAVTYGIIAAVKWLTDNWVLVLSILGGVVAAVGIAAVVAIIVRKQKKKLERRCRSMRETKDSGLEWIGEIPAEWGLSKIGQVYRLRNTKVSDTDYPPLSVTNKGIVPQLDTAAKTNAHDDRKLVRKGDFAINSRSDRRGSCGISDYDGSVSLINTILAPLGEMNPGYYDWLFHTVQFGDEFYKFGHGIVDDLWTTGWQDMKKITIPTPPLAEQRRIADFLDAKCAEIDALTADIQTQIDTLEQYKRSIITETVTKG